MTPTTLIEKLRQRARDARLVAEACTIHNVGASGYDPQLDEDAANEIERLQNGGCRCDFCTGKKGLREIRT